MDINVVVSFLVLVNDGVCSKPLLDLLYSIPMVCIDPWKSTFSSKALLNLQKDFLSQLLLCSAKMQQEC